MKLIHTADLHLDSKMESNLTKDQASIRRAELLETFENIIKYAAENEVEAVLICGDMFDKSNVRKTAMRHVIELIKNYPQITFLYLKGNHDCESFDAELAIEMPENLKLFSQDKWMQYDFGDIVVAGREINEDNKDSIYGDLVLDVAKTNIVMLHGDGFDYKSLRGKYIDYLALGHIHGYSIERLDERGEACYPGCPEPRGFDECGQKGFVLLEVNDKKVSHQFIPFQQRTFREQDVEINPNMDMMAVYKAVEDAVKDIPEKDLVKLIITGETDIDRDIDCDRIQERFFGRFFFIKIYDRTKAHIEYESFAYDRSLKGSFVRLVQNLDIPESRKADIIETGIRAVMGESVE